MFLEQCSKHIVSTLKHAFCNSYIYSYCILTLFFDSIESRKIDGTTFLDDQQFNQNPIWINLLALLMITLVSLIGTYVALRLMKKGK